MSERLTEKINNYYTCDYSLTKNVCDKLGQLEDIEEELGIDLITLYKATLNGIYYTSYGQIVSSKDMGFSVAFCRDYLLIIDSEIEHSYHIKDYGKKWSLVKEELENEN